jgi:hypothetical protein
MAIRKSILTSTLKSKINIINNAAADYGADRIDEIPSPKGNWSFNRLSPGATTSAHLQETITLDGVTYKFEDFCRMTYIQELVSNGYMNPDRKDSREVTNPLTGEVMNETRVCIRFDTSDSLTRQIIAYVIDERCLTGEEEEDNCDL